MHRRAAIGLVAVPVLLWGLNYHVGAAAVETIPPPLLAWFIWLAATVVLVPAALLRERDGWRRIRPRLRTVAGLGLVGMAVSSLATYEALRHAGPVDAAVITSLSPLLIVVLAAATGRSPGRPGIPRRTWPASVLALGGVLLVVTRGEPAIATGPSTSLGATLLGAAVAAIAVVGWSVYVVGMTRLGDLPALTATAVQALAAAVVLAPAAVVAVIAGPPGVGLPTEARGWWGLAFLLVLPYAVGYLLWNAGSRAAGPALSSMALNLVPVSAVILGVAFGQEVTWVQLAGVAIVVGALVWSTVGGDVGGD